VTQLTRDENISVAPCLSPDGRSLAYTGYKSGYADVYEINLGSGARSASSNIRERIRAAYAPDGSRLAVTLSKDGNPGSTTSANGSGARRLDTRGRIIADMVARRQRDHLLE
jgi:TolB protein